ncbi:unnamed protein product [Mortierella alpina]
MMTNKNLSACPLFWTSPKTIMRFLSVCIILYSVAAAVSAEPGSYVLYSFDHFMGEQVAVKSCGCHNLPYHDSYRWFPYGSGGRAYKKDHCAGRVVKEFSEDENESYEHYPEWKSIVIDC